MQPSKSNFLERARVFVLQVCECMQAVTELREPGLVDFLEQVAKYVYINVRPRSGSADGVEVRRLAKSVS